MWLNVESKRIRERQMSSTCDFCGASFSHILTHCPKCGTYEGLAIIDETGKSKIIKSHEEFVEAQKRTKMQKQQKLKNNKLKFISRK